MKKTLFLSFLTLFLTVALQAREFTIGSLELNPTDLSARTQPVYDLNDVKCALIRLSLPQDGGKFLGNVLKQEYLVNEYRVYVSHGTRELQFMYPGMETLRLDLRPYTDGQGLESGATYILSLSGYEDPTAGNVSPGNNVNGNYLILDVTPKIGVMVEIDGKLQNVDSWPYSSFLDFGQHGITVRAPGYAPYTETVDIVKGNKMERDIKLESLLSHLTINSATSDAIIKINGKEKGAGTFSDDLTPGRYLVEVEKTGYRPYSQTIELQEKEKRTLDIPALQPVYANLDVAYTPAGSIISIDGKEVGNTPQVLFDILVGPHAVTVSKEGYLPYTAEVNLQEGHLARLEGELQIDEGLIEGHEAVDLGLSVKWASCNVGAKKPSNYGNYYAWGETETKKSYKKNNSKTYNKKINDIGGTQYDVAHTDWGGNWRLPTPKECWELIDKCKWDWTTLDGHPGYTITGPNGNSIFLPAAGGRDGGSVYNTGLYGFYSTSAPNTEDVQVCVILEFDPDFSTVTSSFYRYSGVSVRPVLE